MIFFIAMCLKKSIMCTYTHGVYIFSGEIDMWTTPTATEMRFGFEVTMYVMNK